MITPSDSEVPAVASHTVHPLESTSSHASISWPPTRHSSCRRDSLTGLDRGVSFNSNRASVNTLPTTQASMDGSERASQSVHQHPTNSPQWVPLSSSTTGSGGGGGGGGARQFNVECARCGYRSEPASFRSGASASESPSRSADVSTSDLRRRTSLGLSGEVDPDDCANCGSTVLSAAGGAAAQEDERPAVITWDAVREEVEAAVGEMSREELERGVSALRGDNRVLRNDLEILKPKVEELREGIKASHVAVEREGEQIENQLQRRIDAVKRGKQRLMEQLSAEEKTKAQQECKLVTIKKNCDELAKHLKQEEALIATRMKTRLHALQAERKQLETLLHEQSASVSELLTWAENVRALDNSFAGPSGSMVGMRRDESTSDADTRAVLRSSRGSTDQMAHGSSLVREAYVGESPAHVDPENTKVQSKVLERGMLQKHNDRLSLANTTPTSEDPPTPIPTPATVLASSGMSAGISSSTNTNTNNNNNNNSSSSNSGSTVANALDAVLIGNRSSIDETEGLVSIQSVSVVNNPRGLLEYLANEIDAVSLLQQEAVERVESYRKRQDELEQRIAKAERDREQTRRSVDTLQRELSVAASTVNEIAAANEVAWEMQSERELNMRRRSRAQSMTSTTTSYIGVAPGQIGGDSTHALRGNPTGSGSMPIVIDYSTTSMRRYDKENAMMDAMYADEMAEVGSSTRTPPMRSAMLVSNSEDSLPPLSTPKRTTVSQPQQQQQSPSLK